MPIGVDVMDDPEHWVSDSTCHLSDDIQLKMNHTRYGCMYETKIFDYD